MEQVIFVVWRESIEALLVVGILYSWLKQFGADGTLRYLWFGVAGGVGTALVLAAALLGLAQYLSGTGQDIFMLIMMLAATGLIVHMVMWMREHGRTLHKHFGDQTRKAIENQAFWSISLLVAIAIAREGSETVIFLYGMSYAQQTMQDWASFAGAVLFAMVLAGGTYYLLQASRRWMSWKHFFRFTEIMLLLLAGALLVSSVDKMISLGWLPALVDPVWDTSAILSDSSRFGGVVSALTGYRAYPSLMTLLVWLGYWAVVLGMFKYQNRQTATPAAAAT
ncbi:FTR1 family iron permease [Marinobacter sp. C2H3]|uniref:FTR1 family iron permease n=1 Tax=Marinobacter sp. C2H3 TaxID=3119003 RepID=UPI00300F0274